MAASASSSSSLRRLRNHAMPSLIIVVSNACCSATAPAETVAVVFDPLIEGGEIRYTLDGNDPPSASPLHQGPLQVTAPTWLNARTFLKTGNTSDVAEFQFQK